MRVNRRELFKMSGAALAAGTMAKNARAAGDNPDEFYPVSPLIRDPFNELTNPLPVPAPLQPESTSQLASGDWAQYKPMPALGGTAARDYYKIWPGDGNTLPQPLYYKIEVKQALHNFTPSQVSYWNPATGDHVLNTEHLPPSTMYAFNGTFPGPMIYARYWQPSMVRFVNKLEEKTEPLRASEYYTSDFGVKRFLTHLHNGHTGPESDGNPNHMHHTEFGREIVASAGNTSRPGVYQHILDNLYLNWPAGGDERECQSYCWFHDHEHSHTGANVYKGMVGLYPLYYRSDTGDERTGYRLPGVPNDITKRTDYDIPLAFYDCRLDDGVTPHSPVFDPTGPNDPRFQPDPLNRGRLYWGRYPDKGFVGDIFTVNCKAFPVLRVKRRKYRFRLLGASLSRVYRLQIMTGGTVEAMTSATHGSDPEERQGQYWYRNGQHCMRMVQVAAEGGLLPAPIVRDFVDIWPGKRRELVVDFTKYKPGFTMNGTNSTLPGQELYLVNTCQMKDGLKPDSYTSVLHFVPMLKFIIDDGTPPVDNSLVLSRLRPVPPLPADLQTRLTNGGIKFRKFHLGKGPEWFDTWVIKYDRDDGSKNDMGWHGDTPDAAKVPQGSDEVWEFTTGGGWIHPMHIHQEEHRVIARGQGGLTGVPETDFNGMVAQISNPRPDDVCKEDVIAMGDGESKFWIYRKFRTFKGRYVAHCHNLAHEDHSMMFGFEIT